MLNPHVPYPRAEEFSLGFQRELTGNNRLAVNYVGNIVKHNPRTIAYNRISVGTNTVNVPALAENLLRCVGQLRCAIEPD